jgi:transcriptional regulator with XRE-family HTH domain
MKAVKLMLAELRKEKGITQSELADYLGVSFQSISKWETGKSMPDITLLPKLAEYFQISVDEILGLKPLSNKQYISSGTDRSEHWNKKLDYLKVSRIGFWNDDYLEFLVTKVWKISKPINIVDFGCGYGYLGMALLPILPKGSTYTGIDISETLISEAKSLFKDSEYIANFFKSDLNEYVSKEKYDLAICQALLRHLPNPGDILKKMVDAVTIGGMVICIEVNREFENAGLYIKGMDYNSFGTTPVWQKLWKKELVTEGRDYSIGMKIPSYMQEYGLKNINVRINDKVNLINPHGDKNFYNELFNAIVTTNNWNRALSDEEIESIIVHFMNRGLTRAEAEMCVKSNIEISEYLMKNPNNAFILKTLCLLISYGIK